MITENLKALQAKIPSGVQLIIVTKTQSIAAIKQVYKIGYRAFGENRTQELLEKKEQLPSDIEWHLIGHLQTNKVKYIVPFVHLIHSVHSFKLLKEINKRAEISNRTVNILLQFHIADEDTKSGFTFEEVLSLLEDPQFLTFENISIKGIMGMATFTEDKNQIHQEFRTLHNYFQVLKSNYFKFNNEFHIISMGMSGDFEIAIEEGSNMVRIGSSVFK